MGWLPVSVTTPPASEPLTLAEVKAQCRVTSSDSDTILTDYITRARQAAEEYTGTKFVSQTVEFHGDDFTARLPIAPISSVSSVKYLDEDGAEQTLATSVYETVTQGLEPELRLKLDQSWPTIRAVSDAVRVVAVCGYSTLPTTIKHAMLLMIATWFDDRESGEMPQAALHLLRNHRRLQ